MPANPDNYDRLTIGDIVRYIGRVGQFYGDLGVVVSHDGSGGDPCIRWFLPAPSDDETVGFYPVGHPECEIEKVDLTDVT